MGKFNIENFKGKYEGNYERLCQMVEDGEMDEIGLEDHMRLEMVDKIESYFGIKPFMDLSRDQMLEVVEFASKLDKESPYLLILTELVDEWSKLDLPDRRPDWINLEDYL
jgi:hypothetical protein